jgi:hypothetical protein
VSRIRASLTAAALLLVSLASAGPAAAGGPTSALLSVPGEGKTASLYYTDPQYDALARLVGVTTVSGVGAVDKSGASHEDGGPGITVTWMIHDVMPWRVDRIYLNGKDGPWISTQTSPDGASIWESPVVWHQSASGKELVMLLDDLGVGAAAREAGDFDGVAGAPVEAPAEPTTRVAPSAGQADTSSRAVALWWAVAGGFVGAAVTLLGTRVVRHTRADRDTSPRRELIDA